MHHPMLKVGDNQPARMAANCTPTQPSILIVAPFTLYLRRERAEVLKGPLGAIALIAVSSIGVWCSLSSLSLLTYQLLLKHGECHW